MTRSARSSSRARGRRSGSSWARSPRSPPWIWASTPRRPRSRAPAWSPTDVDELVFGHGRQAGNGPNPAARSPTAAASARTSPAFTVNMACGCGTKADPARRRADHPRQRRGGRRRRPGEHDPDAVPAGPDAVRLPDGRRHRLRRHVQGRVPRPALRPGHGRDGGEPRARATASRARSPDEFALRSQQKADAAWARRAKEIAPSRSPGRRARSTVVERDEHSGPDTTLEGLAAAEADVRRRRRRDAPATPRGSPTAPRRWS